MFCPCSRSTSAAIPHARPHTTWIVSSAAKRSLPNTNAGRRVCRHNPEANGPSRSGGFVERLTAFVKTQTFLHGTNQVRRERGLVLQRAAHGLGSFLELAALR